MQALTRAAGRRAAMAVVLVIVSAAVLATIAPNVSAGGSGSGGCTVYESGQWITVQCGSGGGTGGTGSTGGSGSTQTTTCTFAPIDAADAKTLGLAWPPPKGMAWALMYCGTNPLRLDFLVLNGAGPLAVLVNAQAGRPAVTPQQLLQRALDELLIPTLEVHTAPPLGHDGLVGLPEWFWVPAADWHQLSVTVRAGPVWATATATPTRLTFDPGGGLSAVTCAGPGQAYNQARAAAQQYTRCSYTYEQASANQPGHAYQATLAVNWRISWTGSGGTGGLVNPALAVRSGFTLPVAQGEALVTGP